MGTACTQAAKTRYTKLTGAGESLLWGGYKGAACAECPQTLLDSCCQAFQCCRAGASSNGACSFLPQHDFC